MILDYGQLVKDYWENLNTQLRGFNAGAEFLDTWVPDEDPVRSIQSLFESAELHGLDYLEVRIPNEIVSQVGREKLLHLLEEFGKVKVLSEGNGLSIGVGSGSR